LSEEKATRVYPVDIKQCNSVVYNTLQMSNMRSETDK